MKQCRENENNDTKRLWEILIEIKMPCLICNAECSWFTFTASPMFVYSLTVQCCAVLCCVQWHLHFQLNLAIGEYASIKFKYPLGSFFFIFIFWNAFAVVEFDEWLVCHVDDGIRFRYYALTWNLNMIFVSVFCFCLPPQSGLCDLMASSLCHRLYRCFTILLIKCKW